MNLLQRATYLFLFVCKSFFLRLTKKPLKSSAAKKVIFVIHFHYVDQLSRLLPLVVNASKNSSLLITSSNENVLEVVSRAGLDYKKVPNMGRNFGGLLEESVCSRISNNQIVVHLHGKKSTHSPVLGIIWNYILWSHLTNPGVLEKVVEKMSDKSGWVAFPDFSKVFSKESAGWGRSARHLEHLPSEMRDNLKSDPDFNFPMGGMFVCDSELITDLKSVLDEIPYGFKVEPISEDAELPHFLERLVGVVAYNHGGIHLL